MEIPGCRITNSGADKNTVATVKQAQESVILTQLAPKSKQCIMVIGRNKEISGRPACSQIIQVSVKASVENETETFRNQGYDC